jgi:small subunit ribosomal protein S6
LREQERAPRKYELMTILHPEVAEETLPGELDRIASYIAGAGGELIDSLRESPWGRRRLAYPIRSGGRDVRDGYYTVWHFNLGPNRINDLERELKLNTQVIRYLVVSWEPRPVSAKELEAAEIAAEEAAAAEYAAAQAAADAAEEAAAAAFAAAAPATTAETEPEPVAEAERAEELTAAAEALEATGAELAIEPVEAVAQAIEPVQAVAERVELEEEAAAALAKAAEAAEAVAEPAAPEAAAAEEAPAEAETPPSSGDSPPDREGPGGGTGLGGEVPAGAVRGDESGECPDDYPVKGNASSMLYHTPGTPAYKRTIPEFCFASVEAAEAAGFGPTKFEAAQEEAAEGE